MGLVNRVYPADQLMNEARAYASDLAQNVSPTSMAIIKQQVWRGVQTDMATSNELSDAEMRASLKRGDFKEGVEQLPGEAAAGLCAVHGELIASRVTPACGWRHGDAIAAAPRRGGCEQLAVHHTTPGDHGVARRGGAAPQPSLDGVGDGAGEGDPGERPYDEVAHRTELQRAELAAASQTGRTTERRHPRGRLGRTTRPARISCARVAGSFGTPSTTTPSRSTMNHRSPGRPARPPARNSLTGAIPPPPIIMLELGQCATPTPAAPSRRISAPSG